MQDRHDRENHDSVLSDFERLLLQRPIREWNPQEVISALLNISKRINDQEIFGVKNGNKGKFRNGTLLIRRYGGEEGIFFYPSAMKEELKNKPEHLKLYEGLVRKTKKLAINYGEKPIEPEGKGFKPYWEHNILDVLSKDGPSQGVHRGTPLYAFVNEYYRLIDSTPKEIQQQMVGLIQEVKRLFAEETPVAAAAYGHQLFVNTHPFADANGRVARLLMNTVLRQGGLPSVAFYSDAEYTNVVSRSLNENTISLFESYLSDTVCKVTSLRQDKEFQNGQAITDLVTSCAQQLKNKRTAEAFNNLFASCKKQFDTLVQQLTTHQSQYTAK